MAKNKVTPFGKWIKMRLLEKDMSSTELAQRIGTTKHRISEITRGVIPGTKYKEKIIEVLADTESERKKAYRAS